MARISQPCDGRRGIGHALIAQTYMRYADGVGMELAMKLVAKR